MTSIQSEAAGSTELDEFSDGGSLLWGEVTILELAPLGRRPLWNGCESPLQSVGQLLCVLGVESLAVVRMVHPGRPVCLEASAWWAGAGWHPSELLAQV